MRTSRMPKTIAATLVLIVVGVLGYFLFKPSSASVAETPATALRAEPSAFTHEYKNDARSFSLMLPDGFTGREIAGEASGESTVIIENGEGNGVQITMSPFDDVKTLTVADIHQDLPDMKIDDAQAVEIGSEHTGIAFRSDNPAFEGDSRDVWFVFRGTLYQITTYARNDAFLQALFATWKFF